MSKSVNEPKGSNNSAVARAAGISNSEAVSGVFRTGPHIGGGAAQPPSNNIGSEIGTTPTNRVPDICIDGQDQVFFDPLRFGVDSLYASFKGRTRSKVEDELERLKKLAQSPDPLEQAQAQIQIGSHIFEVKDRGAKLFPYILEDGYYRIQIPKHNSKAMPVAYVRISSHALAGTAADDLVEDLRGIVDFIGEEVQEPKVSRIDLFLDFVSSVDMESWSREAWITRADKISTYAVGNTFSGWTVGAGGPLSMRLYDKTLEIITKSHKTWLYPLWEAEGWSGQDRVWRLEFQFNTEVLGQLSSREYYTVADRLDAMWKYATGQWLKLAVPSDSDATRGRWPIHPLWLFIQGVPFDGDGGELARTYPIHRGPSAEGLMHRGMASLSSHMALRNTLDFREGADDYIDDMEAFHRKQAESFGIPFERLIREKVMTKVRQFGTAMNEPTGDAESEAQAETDAAAEQYRRQTKG